MAIGCGDSGGGSSGGFGSFGDPELDWLVGIWEEESTGDDRLTFRRSPNVYTQEITRQVGDESTPDVPFPTTCRYVETSERFTITMNDVQPDSLGQYSIEFVLTGADLVVRPGNDAACSAFIAKHQKAASRKNLSFTNFFSRGDNDGLVMDGNPFVRVE